MITPRDYQRDAIQAVADRYRAGIRRPLISLPTGTGKTIVFSMVTAGARAKNGRVVIMAHRDELLQQAADKLCAVAPHLCNDIGFVQAGRNEVDAPVVIASVQTLARQARRDALVAAGRPAVAIVDEAHHSAADTYQHVLQDLGCLDDDGPLTIGVTATPQREDDRDLGDTWQEVVFHRDILWMIERGHLCDLRGIAIRLAGFDATQLHVRAGDYQAGEMDDLLTEAEAPLHTVGAWKSHAADRKTLIFTPTVAMASQMRDAFQAAGVTACNISALADHRDARRQALADFKAGKIQVLTNAMLLTEGFDEPSVDCVIIARPTRSQGLFVQMVGRGTRPSPGKTDCLVMDMVGATERHDLITLPSMFGLGNDAETRERIERDGIVQAVQDDPVIRQGRAVARVVDLFNRRALHWIQVSPTHYVLSSLEGHLHLQHHLTESRWTVTLHPRDKDAPRQVIYTGPDEGYAMGAAESHVRDAIRNADSEDRGLARQLVNPEAAWRQQPASDGQVNALRRMRIPVQLKPDGTPDMTKGQASDLITARSARRQARR